MENTLLFKCPNCGLSLNLFNNTYKCKNGHCFDIASSGYLNLIIANRKRSNNSGDNKIMVNSRKDFLSQGYYNILIKEVLDEFINKKHINYLDIGCGEGYFTDNFKKLNNKLNIYAIDISKEAIKKASKLNKKINWIVGSVNNLPIKDNSIDILTQIFAPHNVTEYTRVLKDDGLIITVTPAKNHLYEIKELMYENVYLNSEKIIEDKKIKLVKEKTVNSILNITNNTDIVNLLKMTPYYYTTSKSNIEKVLNLKKLDVTSSFTIRIYKKN